MGTGGPAAVYMVASAAQVPQAELDRTLAEAPSFARCGESGITAADVRSPASYRLYRATVTGHFVVCPRSAGEPCADHGVNHDHRTRVRLP